MAKLLKEGKDIGGFAIEGKGMGEVWKRGRKELNQKKKKKRGGRGKYNDNEQFTPSEPSDSKEGSALGIDWLLVWPKKKKRKRK